MNDTSKQRQAPTGKFRVIAIGINDNWNIAINDCSNFTEALKLADKASNKEDYLNKVNVWVYNDKGEICGKGGSRYAYEKNVIVGLRQSTQAQ